MDIIKGSITSVFIFNKLYNDSPGYLLLYIHDRIIDTKDLEATKWFLGWISKDITLEDVYQKWLGVCFREEEEFVLHVLSSVLHHGFCLYRPG
jgi:hypothetical protein